MKLALLILAAGVASAQNTSVITGTSPAMVWPTDKMVIADKSTQRVCSIDIRGIVHLVAGKQKECWQNAVYFHNLQMNTRSHNALDDALETIATNLGKPFRRCAQGCPAWEPVRVGHCLHWDGRCISSGVCK